MTLMENILHGFSKVFQVLGSNGGYWMGQPLTSLSALDLKKQVTAWIGWQDSCLLCQQTINRIQQKVVCNRSWNWGQTSDLKRLNGWSVEDGKFICRWLLTVKTSNSFSFPVMAVQSYLSASLVTILHIQMMTSAKDMPIFFHHANIFLSCIAQQHHSFSAFLHPTCDMIHGCDLMEAF